jgi:hypothetical protein
MTRLVHFDADPETCKHERRYAGVDQDWEPFVYCRDCRIELPLELRKNMDPHKHQLKFERAMTFIYVFRCRSCGATWAQNKFSIRSAIMGKCKPPTAGYVPDKSIKAWFERGLNTILNQSHPHQTAVVGCVCGRLQPCGGPSDCARM